MISLEDSRETALVLAGLADPIRMRVLQLLLPGPMCVGDLAKHLGLPMVNTSHHLKVMRRADILEHVKQGRQVLYSINPNLHTAGGPDGSAGTMRAGTWTLLLGKAPAKPARPPAAMPKVATSTGSASRFASAV
jgi:DNA-binding transcriptional ArsR family regulator